MDEAAAADEADVAEAASFVGEVVEALEADVEVANVLVSDRDGAEDLECADDLEAVLWLASSEDTDAAEAEAAEAEAALAADSTDGK